MSPFSLPVMQMGFEPYLNLIYERPALLERLMAINEEFCVAWANAQLDAGAHFIVYFDPVSSPTILRKEKYGAMGLGVARRTLARIHGPKAMHFASGRTLAILNEVAENGAAAVGVSCLEDLAVLKAACRDRMTVVGNLNGIEMARWTPAEAEEAVKTAIAKAGSGGGFILCDTHGEIPWQVPDRTLSAIGDAVRRWGQYPLARGIEMPEGRRL
jgi:uroporphyrinogen decarboxylase